MHFRFKIGLKLYSTDTHLITEALILKDNFFDFIELYVIPGSYNDTIDAWKELNVPYVIHAPHAFHGVNLAQKNKRETNLKHFEEVRLFADALKASIIVVHGGNNGSLLETIEQISLLNDKRIIIENKPKIGLSNELCIGWSPEEFQKIADAGILYGTALDFVHAACAARSEGIDERLMISGFSSFCPKVFHLSDGHTSSEKDIHLNLGKGDLDLRFYLSCIPTGGSVTIETPRSPSRGMEDFAEDVAFLIQLLNK